MKNLVALALVLVAISRPDFYMETLKLQKIVVLQQQINFLICLLFVQFAASVELDIQEGYLTSNPKHSELQWIAKKIIAEYPCMAGRILVDVETEWIGEVLKSIAFPLLLVVKRDNFVLLNLSDLLSSRPLFLCVCYHICI